MEYVGCGPFHADAVLFSIDMSTNNLYLGFRGVAWERSQVLDGGASFRPRVKSSAMVGRHSRCWLCSPRSASVGALHAERRRHSRNVVAAGATSKTTLMPRVGTTRLGSPP